MNTAKSHLNILVQLARIDGVVVQEEIDLIKEIGKANGLSSEEISECFEDPHDVSNSEDLDDDLKFDYMYNIVQLMKIDGRIYKEEINYCARIASKLGYNENALREMMLKIYSNPDISSDKESLKNTVLQYLKK